MIGGGRIERMQAQTKRDGERDIKGREGMQLERKRESESESESEDISGG